MCMLQHFALALANALSENMQRVIYEPSHDLKTAIASTGHSYTEITNIIIGEKLSMSYETRERS